MPFLTSIVSGREGSLTLFSLQCEKVISNHFLRCLIPILLFGATVVHYEKSREFALLRGGRLCSLIWPGRYSQFLSMELPELCRGFPVEKSLQLCFSS